MAIHVKELVIRANVGNGQQVNPSGSAEGSTTESNPNDFVKATVAETLRILKDKKNR